MPNVIQEQAKQAKLTLRGVQLKLRVGMSYVKNERAHSWVIACASFGVAWTAFNRTHYYLTSTK